MFVCLDTEKFINMSFEAMRDTEVWAKLLKIKIKTEVDLNK